MTLRIAVALDIALLTRYPQLCFFFFSHPIFLVYIIIYIGAFLYALGVGAKCDISKEHGVGRKRSILQCMKRNAVDLFMCGERAFGRGETVNSGIVWWS